MQLWGQLKRSNTPLAKDKLGKSMNFMQMFNEYNKTLNNSIVELKERPKNIQGRQKEIELLYAILERPETPVALLLGLAGVGKTALVEELGKQINSGDYKTELNNEYLLLALRLGSLSALKREQLQSSLSNILDRLYVFEKYAQKALNKPNLRIVLFIDEIHMLVTIFGPGTKIGGDVIKDVLARSPIRVIGATTRREYDSTIIVDKPLSERFKQVEMSELDPDIVEEILFEWWNKIAPDCPVPSREIMRRVIKANAMYRSDSAEPRKSLDILEDFVSYCRRKGKPVDDDVVNAIFKDRFAINLKFEIDPDEAYKIISDGIEGQPHTLYTMKRALRSLVMPDDPMSNKPLLTMLFSGPTGVGKTETAKLLSQALYPGEKVLFNINMPDYKTQEHERVFRKVLGEQVRHVPNSIVLFDEFEKSGEAVQDAMLSILDEGIVSFDTENREGNIETNHVSLRNTIIIATTNAGVKVFQTNARYSKINGKEDASEKPNDEQKAEIDNILKDLREELLALGFKPEMLNRFNRIIPYKGLSNTTFAKIADSKLEKLANQFKTLYGINVLTNEKMDWPKETYDCYGTDVAVYISFVKAKADNPSSGGARSIHHNIQSEVRDSLVDAVFDNKGKNTFKIEIDKETKIYKPGASPVVGGVRVYAID